MKVKYIRIISLLLAVMIVLSLLLSCQNNNEKFPEETTSPLGVMVNSDWKIVRAFKMSNSEKDIIKFFASAIANTVGELELKTDMLEEGESPAEYEILIGGTNREESNLDLSDVEGAYSVVVVGKKIVVCANSAYSLDAALGKLANELQKNAGFIPEDFTCNGTAEPGEKLVLVGDQKANQIAVYDISGGSLGAPLWTATPTNPAVAGLKYRKIGKYGEIIMYCGGDGKAQIIKYPSSEVVLTVKAAQNPHSVEISPDGNVFAVASSNGNTVRFFNTDDTSKFTDMTLADAHGVLYDEEAKCFLAVGRNVLTAYTAKIASDGKVDVSEIAEKKYTIPADHAHDLQPVAGDKNKIWISTAEKVYQFDKSTGEFSENYKNANKISRSSVKGISSFKDGSFCLIFPDKLYQTWTSKTFYASNVFPFSGAEETMKLTFDGNENHLYKIRAFVSDYAY